MTKVIGVRFRTGARIYFFDPGELEVQEGDGVIVETARGLEFGDVAHGVKDVPEEQVIQPLKPVVRIATDGDKRSRAENAAKEADAFSVCERKIAEHGLDMKLVDVEYTFNGSKVVFYFTADERVDFRELVKDLASQFRTRIELRQIGVRDEAKMLGGLGSCGRPVCCKTFLDDFKPVSIKMAKEQNLSLSPTKISGLCGRLMCCLQYEQSSYEEMKKKMPRTGREVQTPDGLGIALENNAITEKTKVRVTLADGSIEMREYHYTNLGKPGEVLNITPQPPAKAPQQSIEERRAAEAYRPVETPQAQPAEGPARKKRRRGGRGRNGNGGGRGPEEQGQPQKQPASNGGRPDGNAQQRNPRPARQTNGQNNGPAAGQGAEDAPAKSSHRHRRRSGRSGAPTDKTPTES